MILLISENLPFQDRCQRSALRLVFFVFFISRRTRDADFTMEEDPLSSDSLMNAAAEFLTYKNKITFKGICSFSSIFRGWKFKKIHTAETYAQFASQSWLFQIIFKRFFKYGNGLSKTTLTATLKADCINKLTDLKSREPWFKVV